MAPVHALSSSLPPSNTTISASSNDSPVQSTASTSTPPPSSSPARSITIRAHNPLPLTSAQEAEVRELYYKRVRDKCADEIRGPFCPVPPLLKRPVLLGCNGVLVYQNATEFAHCATGRTFTIPIVCRSQRLAMNTCMNSYATREEEDRAREQWFERLPERRAEREREEEWKEGQRRLKREWWELDESGRRRTGTGTGGEGVGG